MCGKVCDSWVQQHQVRWTDTSLETKATNHGQQQKQQQDQPDMCPWLPGLLTGCLAPSCLCHVHQGAHNAFDWMMLFCFYRTGMTGTLLPPSALPRHTTVIWTLVSVTRLYSDE
jgi:hypothetical protein